MNVRKSTRKNKTVLNLTGDLTFDGVSGVLAAYRKVSNADTLEISFAELGDLDLSGLQLIYALQFDRNQAGMAITFTGDDALQRMARMAEFAGLPQLQQE